MSSVIAYVWLIPLLPLGAAVLTAFLGPRFLRNLSHWPCIIAVAFSCVLSVFALIELGQGAGEFAEYFEWFRAGNVVVGFSLRADGLSAIMLVMITFIGSLIAIFSVGYMHGDPGYPRFFAEVSLFIFSMTGLVLADNLILVYAFWEGVGLCSYLLIGFWFAKPAAAAAARKAFLVTRLGDVGFLLGILLFWHGSRHQLDFGSLFGAVRAGMFSESTLTLGCLLLFCGAVGKSAQFPLHVWLPDAMEGPTPVSALIHAATMVTAGVYLVARCTPIFEHAPDAQLVVSIIGGVTALLAALIALTQTDLKRVLAYSTVSQLGFMFLALGTGVGVVAAIFHLFTHAFFKALLFLAAGSVMHAMGNVIDMRRFSGLRRVLPITHATFLCGAAALAGVPLLSGFWSKDEILGSLFHAGQSGDHARASYMTLWGVALVTAGLTAFYTARAYFLTFWGEERIPEEAGHHAHESPAVMTIPLIVLAIGAVGIGMVVEPFTHWFSKYLTSRTHERLGRHLEEKLKEHLEEPQVLVMGLSILVALAGIAAAWWMYVRRPGSASRLASDQPRLYQLSLNKFHLDELYYAFVVAPMAGFAVLCRIIDQYVVDGVVDLLGQAPRLIGHLFRPVQNGLVQFYAVAMLLGIAVFLIALLAR